MKIAMRHKHINSFDSAYSHSNEPYIWYYEYHQKIFKVQGLKSVQ